MEFVVLLFPIYFGVFFSAKRSFLGSWRPHILYFLSSYCFGGLKHIVQLCGRRGGGQEEGEKESAGQQQDQEAE